MGKPVKRTTRFRPVQILGGSFLALILTGTALLMLPVCHAAGSKITFLDALFTSTSAVCVTGLIVVDTSTAWTRLGQTVILLLIQLGGIGIISFGALFAIFLGRRISFHERALIKEQFGEFSTVSIFQLIPVVASSTFAIELAGVVCLYPFFIRDFGASEAAYHSVFHSISAFCNAGFSTFSNNLENYHGHLGVNLIICALIVTGGIGFPVLTELLERRGPRRQLSLHTKVVLRTTALLIILGTVIIFILETGLNEGFKELPIASRILGSLFQSVTCRTAGFNTLPIGSMSQATLLVMILLMFIGGSPSGTAGGVKTTTFAVCIAAIGSVLRGHEDVVLFDRRVERNTVRRALVLMVLCSGTLFLALVLLAIAGTGEILRLTFELFSAFGTVGLSTGITSQLSVGQRLVIIGMMYIGRLGPLSFVLALSNPKVVHIKQAQTGLLTG